jgi:hypothetical protein
MVLAQIRLAPGPGGGLPLELDVELPEPDEVVALPELEDVVALPELEVVWPELDELDVVEWPELELLVAALDVAGLVLLLQARAPTIDAAKKETGIASRMYAP